MIQYNKAYSINNGQDSILFKEGKGNTVTGEYQDVKLTGTIEGNVLKATYHNQNNNTTGPIEITFTKNGFDAKWKQGFEPGPLNCKWKGKLKIRKMIPIWAWLTMIVQMGIIIMLFIGLLTPKISVVDREVIKTVIKTDTVEKEITKTIIQKDTLYIKEIEQVESKFNALQFAVGKYDLSEDAKYILYDLSKLLDKNQEIKLKIEGHTSDEGSPSFNQKLSENRAKAVVEFLVKRGIKKNRLTFDGKGSSMPVDLNKRELNRRTEFILE
jgi:outer membrane protein OmpA-like peptidoglycan-associated protein